jgi:putative endonuclease
LENEIVFYVYLLKSGKDSELYIGFTNNIEQRVKQHNNGLVPSTKLRRPFELIYFEGYKSEKDARNREKNLKLRSRAFAQLKKRIITSLL